MSKFPLEVIREVSIHAPAGGATEEEKSWQFRRIRFNPRTRRGCDSRGLKQGLWGPRFNPRTRRGCDPLAPAAQQDL